MFDLANFKNLNLDEQHKEVYAYFGLAIYYSQVIEHQLLNMLLLVNIVNGEITVKKEYEKCFYSIFNKTMGKLIKQINRQYKLKSRERQKLESLLKRRNYLAHHYFKDNINLFGTLEGRITLITYFDDFIEEIKKIDDKLNNYVKKFIAKHINAGHSSQVLLNEVLSGKDVSTLRFNRNKKNNSPADSSCSR